MNERGAVGALEAISLGSWDKIDPLAEWLAQQKGCNGRYMPGDLAGPIRRVAERVAKDLSPELGLAQLLTELAGRPDSWLVALFGTQGPTTPLRFDGAVVGKASDIASEIRFALPEALSGPNSSDLAVLVSHEAQGRLGAVRTALWLQTVLGALSLAAYAHRGAVAPIATCPTVARAAFSEGGDLTTVESAARFPVGGAPTHLDHILDAPGAEALISDAAAREPADLVQARLTRAARWLQGASSAVSAADAFVCLGVALETITNDRSKSQVVDRIAKKAAAFLAGGVTSAEREDVFYDELRHAKTLYDFRSRATHGQYDELVGDQATNDARRHEFHSFVADVCLAFRRHMRERQIVTEEEFDEWWRRVEIQGVFV